MWLSMMAVNQDLIKKIGPFPLRQQNNLWKMKVEYKLSNKLDDNNKLFCINLKWYIIYNGFIYFAGNKLERS